MARSSAAIPEALHWWIDFGLTEASLEVVHNDDRLVLFVTRYASGNTLHTTITYVTDRTMFGARAYLVFAVFDVDADGRTNRVQLTDELSVSGPLDGVVMSMNMRTKLVANTRAVADVLQYGMGIRFESVRPVERTSA